MSLGPLFKFDKKKSKRKWPKRPIVIVPIRMLKGGLSVNLNGSPYAIILELAYSGLTGLGINL